MKPAAFATGPPLVDEREDAAMALQMGPYHDMARLLQPAYGQMQSQQAMLHSGAGFAPGLFPQYLHQPFAMHPQLLASTFQIQQQAPHLQPPVAPQPPSATASTAAAAATTTVAIRSALDSASVTSAALAASLPTKPSAVAAPTLAASTCIPAGGPSSPAATATSFLSETTVQPITARPAEVLPADCL